MNGYKNTESTHDFKEPIGITFLWLAYLKLYVRFVNLEQERTKLRCIKNRENTTKGPKRQSLVFFLRRAP